jgi:cytochrome c biogenesis protein CcmG/thiol:disulfide interchange protein DsbE|tara:strand:- start:207 stop:731 length:525 start_codon:yes stop_codon:yes gene_type:complete
VSSLRALEPQGLLPLLFVVVALLLPGCDENGADAPPQPAADFTLELFSGESFQLSQHLSQNGGRPLVVNIFASWCIPCKAEAPVLEKVYQEYRQRGVLVIGVAVQDTESAAREFVAEHGITFPTGLDADGSIKKSYSVYGVPQTFFIDSDGLIRYVHVGGVTEELLIHELDKML